MLTFTKRITALLVLFLGLSGFVWAQDGPYTVTFNVNTSNISDTLEAEDVVQIRGNLIATGDSADYGEQNITWDNQSTAVATSQGGDYWQIEVQMMPGDTLIHKFWAGFSLDPEEGVVYNDGWEANGPVDNNYQYVYPEGETGDKSTDLLFYSTGEGRQSPFVEKQDSVGVRLRVNVGRQIQTGDFNPDSHEVQVRGNLSPLTWDGNTGVTLSEQGEAGDNYFYSGVAYFHKDSIDSAVDGTIAYKFYANGWEEGEDRTLSFGSTKPDTTAHFGYFSGLKPTSSKVIDTQIDFAVNVGILEGLGLFNSSIDHVEMRGGINNWGGEDMSFSGLTNNWVLNGVQTTQAVGDNIQFKYFVAWDSTRFDPESDNYIPGIVADNGWEEPGVTAGGNRILVIEDKEQHATGEQYFNGVEPEGLITEDKVQNGSNVEVTFSVNMEPATQIEDDPFVPEEDSLYIVFETPFFSLTQDIAPYTAGINDAAHPDSIERQRFTDDNDDMVYELTLTLKNPTLNHIGFVFGYGKPFTGEEVHTNGGGFEAGRRHYQYIQPSFDGEGNVVWPNTYSMPTLDWKASDLPWEEPPSYAVPIDEDQRISPEDYHLSQNYPNPFNPTTNIKFEIPTAGDVSLTVYNILGQKVATLLDKRMNAGNHVVGFNASGLSSGVYIYQLKVGDITKQKRMTLIK